MLAMKSYIGDPKNIYESLKPFYYVLKLFGLAPFHINFKNGHMKTTFIDYLTFIVFSCFYTYFLYTLHSVAAEAYSLEGRSILMFSFELLHFFQVYLTFFTHIYNFYTRQKIHSFLKMIATFDETIENKNWKFKINHLKNYWNSFFWNGVSAASLTSINVLQLYFTIQIQEIKLLDIIVMIIYAYVTKTNTLTIFEFVFSTFCVQQRLDLLNQSAKFYLKSFTYKSDWPQSVFVMDKIKIVKQIATLHDLLNDSIDIINEVWTMELIPLYIMILTLEVLSIYMTILTWSYDLYSFESMLIYNLWNVYQIVPLILTFRQGSKVAESGRNLMITIGKIINKCHDDKVIEKLKLLEIQMICRQPILNSGFFVIDWTLAFLIAGSVTTYLVILFQFEKPEDLE